MTGITVRNPINVIFKRCKCNYSPYNVLLYYVAEKKHFCTTINTVKKIHIYTHTHTKKKKQRLEIQIKHDNNLTI